MLRTIFVVLILSVTPARACEVALALTVDVSGSISPTEYDLQMGGLADALDDPTVSAAIVDSQVALLLVQWSGTGRQRVMLPWRSITSAADLAAYAQEVRQVRRAWRHFSTAIGEALDFTAAQFADAPPCARQVIDVSGDGISNEGISATPARDRVVARGITVNGLAIENSVKGLTRYFSKHVIGGTGAFVLTATSYRDYPRAIRRKLLNEIAKPVS